MLLADCDVIDLGDRAFDVLHLPGHSPGSIGLWDETRRVLFSGDVIYDGPLLDEIEGTIKISTGRRWTASDTLTSTSSTRDTTPA